MQRILKKSAKKTIPLPSRPEQPTVSQIVQDVRTSSPEDIVFNYEKSDSDIISTSSHFSDSSLSMGEQSKLGSPTIENDSSSRGINAETDTLYNKTVRFIQQTEKLKHGPEVLEAEFKNLESLNEELKKSIEFYKEQAQSLLESNIQERK